MAHQLLTPQREVRTNHLVLTPLTPRDIDDVYRVYSDARTWSHLPSGRWVAREQAEHHVQRAVGDRVRYGLGVWAVRTADDSVVRAGTFVGSGGMSMSDIGVWHLGYRFLPEVWGNGFASELAGAAMSAAADVAPAVPVTGRVLTNNPASGRVLACAGLTLVWQGVAVEQTPPGVERQVWADRALTAEQRTWLLAHA